MIEYLGRGSEQISTDLAGLARENNGKRDSIATDIAVDLLQDYYRVDQKAFASLKPLAFRDGAMHQAIVQLEGTEERTVEQNGQLTVLKSALALEAELLDGTELVPVVPDVHHWNFTRPDDVDTPYQFSFPENRPLIEAWKELRYAGLLSNPHDPTKPEFDADFVLNPKRLAAQAQVVADKTGLDNDRILQSVFVNAAQVMGRRIVHGTPEGQVAPKYWVDLANSAKSVLSREP